MKIGIWRISFCPVNPCYKHSTVACVPGERRLLCVFSSGKWSRGKHFSFAGYAANRGFLCHEPEAVMFMPFWNKQKKIPFIVFFIVRYSTVPLGLKHRLYWNRICQPEEIMTTIKVLFIFFLTLGGYYSVSRISGRDFQASEPGKKNFPTSASLWPSKTTAVT